MSTSLLYHAWGVRTYNYCSAEYKEGEVYIHVEKKPKYQRCVVCGSREVIREGVEEYTVRTLPIGSKAVFLVLSLHVLRCKKCGALRQESRDVAEPRKSYTKAFARYVLELMPHMTISAIAQHLQVGWDLVKSIVKSNLEKKAKRISWRNVRHIAIDEIATKKGHKYMTVVVDLDTGHVLYTAEGKGHESLKPFFQRLRRSRAKLEAVAMDLSDAFAKAVRLYWPEKVAIVHDHYHIVSNMNDVVDKVRREEQNRLEGEGKKVIKGSRYLLLGARERIESMPDKQERLQALLRVNKTLHKVYLLKEDLRQFWSQKSKEEARDFIEEWLKAARAMDNPHVSRFAKTIESRMEGILAWYDYPISSGPLEGLNNKIKVLKRSAYGYRDQHFFGLRILFIHETRFNLSGA